MSSTILMAVSTFNGRNHPRMEKGDQFQGIGNDGKEIIDDNGNKYGFRKNRGSKYCIQYF